MKPADCVSIEKLEAANQVLPIDGKYIPTTEQKLKNTIYEVFKNPYESLTNQEISAYEMLSEAVFWSLGELINNANKANNRWALLKATLFERVSRARSEQPAHEIYQDIDYAIEHSQADLLKKYHLENLDLTAAILDLIRTQKINSFILSEKYGKKIDLTLRIRNKMGRRVLSAYIINNSPITVVDRERVERNLEKIKEDLLNTDADLLSGAVSLYDHAADLQGGGFGAGLRSIVLFLKESYRPFRADILYSTLLQYRSARNSTIFSIELPLLNG